MTKDECDTVYNDFSFKIQEIQLDDDNREVGELMVSHSSLVIVRYRAASAFALLNRSSASASLSPASSNCVSIALLMAATYILTRLLSGSPLRRSRGVRS